MIERYTAPVAVIDAIASRKAEIARLTSELQLCFGIWAKTMHVPDGATLMEANGDTLVVGLPDETEVQG